MKKKIISRFMIISAVVIFFTAFISAVMFIQVLQNQVFTDLQSYEHVISQMEPSELEIDRGEMRITLIAGDGEVLYDSYKAAKEMDNHGNRPEVIEAKNKGVGTKIRWSETDATHTFYYAAMLEDGTILRVAKRSNSLFVVVCNALGVIIFIAVLTFLLCALVARFLTRRMVEPIEKMADNLLMVSEGEVYEEIRPFVSTIKEQHVNILNSAKIRQEFTANVSHELKTPLTAISGYAELMESGMVQSEDMGRFAGQIRKNSNRLLNLINDIIKLSELDSEDIEIPVEEFDLYELVDNTINMMEISADKQEVGLILSGEHVTLHASKNLVEELVYNLISNAIRYNVKGGNVYVRIGTRDGHIFIEVEDTGIGIPKEHQDRIFERFYRVDKSRSKSTGGTGLGLAIVKHIVAQHNATISLESVEEVGTKITVIF